MNRRNFLHFSLFTPFAVGIKHSFAEASDQNIQDSNWRTFEIRYEVDLSRRIGSGRLWLPIPQDMGDYQRFVKLSWNGDTKNSFLYRDQMYGANIFFTQWEKASPRLTLNTTVSVCDRTIATTQRRPYDLSSETLYLQPTEHMPTDGIVLSTANSIVDNTMNIDDKAKAIYEWIVDNTFRDPQTRGCGMGDIKFMLETGDLGGKCADINSLFVGLARAVGIPARESYGVRVAQSKYLESLGASGDISKAHHCRAEYFSPLHGWTAVDPADVRKAVLQEKLPLDSPQIKSLRNYLFGNWEMNWIGFNRARDFKLMSSSFGAIPYLMYPYAETETKILDGRDPEDFNFSMSSAEITPA